MSLWRWSKTSGNNDGADPSINWREGQAPSSINNSSRSMMAALAKARDDHGGMIDTAGTSSAYTVATNQVIDVLTDGFRVSARLHATCNGSPTLSVDGTTAKSITIAPGVPPSAGMLLLGTVQDFTYDETDGEWRVAGIFVPDGIFKTGDTKNKVLNVTDPGWVLGAGRTIGNASSGGTERAHADTQALFVAWHKATVSQNTLFPIQDSSGSPSTRATAGTADENAFADFNANRRLPLPNLKGRAFAGLDNMDGSSANIVADAAADILGGTVGAEKHQLVVAELPNTAGSINVNLPAQTIGTNQTDVLRSTGTSGQQGGGATSGNPVGALTVTIPQQTLVGSILGSNTPHNNMQPTFFGYVFIKL